MATQKRRHNAPLEEVAKNDLEAAVEFIKANPMACAASAVFILACVLAGFGYRAYSSAADKEVGAAYLRALDTEDPSLQAAELAQVSGAKGDLAAEVAYMAGEAAYRAGERDKAKEAFERVRSEYPDSPFAPDAVEGLAFIAEDAGDYAGAVALYQEVMEKWGLSFTARRQLLNVARCKEQLDQLPEAVTAYQEQIEHFAGSNVAADAQIALARLTESNPELFPEEEAPTAEAPGAEAAGAEAAGDEVAGDEVAGDEVAGEEAADTETSDEAAAGEETAPEPASETEDEGGPPEAEEATPESADEGAASDSQ